MQSKRTFNGSNAVIFSYFLFWLSLFLRFHQFMRNKSPEIERRFFRSQLHGIQTAFENDTVVIEWYR